MPANGGMGGPLARAIIIGNRKTSNEGGPLWTFSIKAAIWKRA